MKIAVRILLLAAAIGAGVWIWLTFFPGPEKVIRSRLLDLAKTLSFQKGEGNISKIAHMQRFSDFFTPDVVVSADIRGYAPITIDGRDELVQRLQAARQFGPGVQVELLDINVTLSPDKQSAVANLTGKATISGERDFSVHEFNFMLKKVDGKWLIYRIETVKTLT